MVADLSGALIICTDDVASCGLVLSDVLGPLLVPPKARAAAKRIHLDEWKFERLTTETLVRRGEHGPLAVLDIIRKWRDVVRESLAIYQSSVGEECATSRVGSRIVSGRSVTALEDLELWRISSDAAILVGLSLEDAIEVIWHRLASSGYRKLVRGMPIIQTEECLTVVHIQGRILLHLEDISPDPWPVNVV